MYINSVTLSNKTLSLSGGTPPDKALQQLVASNNKTGVQLSTCKPADQNRLRQRFAYLALVFSTGKGGTDWFASSDECQWAGTTCNGNGTVSEIGLSNVGLKGTIPDDVGLWSDLTKFYVSVNELAGTLPSSIGLWTGLNWFGISVNQFGGNVPKEVSKWASIQTAFFHLNKFTGSMPAFGNNFCPTNKTGGTLAADCGEIVCGCCNVCR
jgi:hypothetical protein